MFTLEARKPPPDQETLRLEVSPEDSVVALKTRIATQRHGWSADQMNVILQGAFLQDPKTMAECGLKDGDFVVITGMVSRDMRRPAGEAEGPLQEMPDEMLPLFSAPVDAPAREPTTVVVVQSPFYEYGSGRVSPLSLIFVMPAWHPLSGARSPAVRRSPLLSMHPLAQIHAQIEHGRVGGDLCGGPA
eukprot:scaffold1541_cov67-Phaeocystis_antarctica.AAC.11